LNLSICLGWSFSFVFDEFHSQKKKIKFKQKDVQTTEKNKIKKMWHQREDI
jgi:hypothetical protein